MKATVLTGVGNKEYYKDQQAQPNVAYLLALSAKKLQPKAILGHGDNFYWNGLGSDDVNYRFLNSFETMYSDPALLNIKWLNVAGNHDLGGSMFICGKRDNQFVECSGTTELLKKLDEKFTRQSTYVSPNNDRWKMPSRYYVERLENPNTGVSVDVFNIDTNAAAVHGAQQTCCQCYGYKMKYGGAQSCSDVARGDTLCAGGDTQMFDACVAQIGAWQADSLRQLVRDAATSTATWKVVNTHYSPHFHMDPMMMAEVNSILQKTGIHLFINGHTHAESHEFGSFNTHFVTNGAGGGIQSESIGEPPPYATEIKSLWRGENSPYGIFELSFAANQMKMQFVTFDDKWVFASNKADTVKGGAQMGHCWLIPKDGSLAVESAPEGTSDSKERDEAEDLTLLDTYTLVQTFYRQQEKRVQIYADFRQGFQVHQKTEHFQVFCSRITEQFSVVSERVNQVEELLRDKKQQVAIAQLLRKVQLEEKDKLLLTSALLIEKMRLSDASKLAEPDDTTVAFLERSVQTLTTKHTACVERINEILDDLRAESADLETA
ncbi:hypothetical protein JM16_001053 [Phytophthora kernoviae]|uniref:Calcineurin-like phosphoesterase domain-containing protein n=1 Tax=Phytophthora kernoviae TaxID=325452 RepID=A0A8T0MAH3_9STRA|nr:hypothetical protein JM16_001053 [Phytophthora kernoviae]